MNPARILIVDDNALNTELVRFVLDEAGHTVETAESADEALPRITAFKPTLILMDIQMPGMDGIEALQWFRKGSNNRFQFTTPSDTPVIAVTANALEGDEQRFLAQGFDDYLSKPFRQSQLQKVLIEHLGAPEAPPTEVPEPTQAAIATPTADEAANASDTRSESHSQIDAIFDQESLRRLRELDPKGENKLIERVAKAFETSVGRLLPQLEDAIKASDHAGILHVVHTLKSSSASLGALKLSHLCAEVESMIRRQSGEDLTPRLTEIPPEIQRVVAGLRLMLESHA